MEQVLFMVSIVAPVCAVAFLAGFFSERVLDHEKKGETGLICTVDRIAEKVFAYLAIVLVLLLALAVTFALFATVSE